MTLSSRRAPTPKPSRWGSRRKDMPRSGSTRRATSSSSFRAAMCSCTNRWFTRTGVRRRSPVQRRFHATIGTITTIDMVEGHYALDAQNHVRFELGPYDHNRPLVIDPVLVYATYLGGSGGDIGYAIAVDSSFDAYIAGVTNSSNFPTAGTPYQGSNKGNGDCFVTKINSAGTALIYSTYLGGSRIRHRHGPCLEQRKRLHHRLHRLGGLPHQSAGWHWHYAFPSNRLTAAIPTPSSPSSMRPAAPWSTPRIWAAAAPTSVRESPSIPPAMPTLPAQPSPRTFPSRLNALQSIINGSQNAFVTKVNFTGEALLYSTYLGGSAADVAQSIQVDSSGNMYIAGYTFSPDFPTVSRPSKARSGAERMPLWPSSTLRAQP